MDHLDTGITGSKYKLTELACEKAKTCTSPNLGCPMCYMPGDKHCGDYYSQTSEIEKTAQGEPD